MATTDGTAARSATSNGSFECSDSAIAVPQDLVAARPAPGINARALLRKCFSFPVLLGALLLAGVFVCGRARLADPDTWWHVAVGERILHTHTWPISDPYSFTARGSDWMASEWLGEVIMALAARLGGLTALTALLIGLAGLLLLLLYCYSFLRTASWKAAFASCLLMLPLAALSFTLRPQLLGYVFLLITLICLECFRQGRGKALWFLPGVFLLWVNTHGTFIFGIMAMGLYWASGLVSFHFGGLEAKRWTTGERRKLAAVFLVCVLALTLTPYGTRPAAYPLQIALSQPVNISNIQEWQPVRFDLWMGKLFLCWVLLFLLAQLFLRPKYRLEEMVLLFFAVYAAFLHERLLLLFAVVFAPVLAAVLARWVTAYNVAKDRCGLNAALLVVIVAGLLALFPTLGELEREVEKKYPVRAVEYVRQHPLHGHMLNDYGWGGYLIWVAGGELSVFIDGRADAYEHNGVHSDYNRITQVDRQTQFLLLKYDVQACLIKRDAPLATFLAALPDWEPVYADDLSILFVRRTKRSVLATDDGTVRSTAQFPGPDRHAGSPIMQMPAATPSRGVSRQL